jgi:hypothetical protein
VEAGPIEPLQRARVVDHEQVQHFVQRWFFFFLQFAFGEYHPYINWECGAIAIISFADLSK